MKPKETISHYIHLLLQFEQKIGGHMLELKLVRFSDANGCTLGTMFLNDVFECFTLEDPHRETKIKKITRIPSGTYEVELRTQGSTSKRYARRYGDTHKGMLHLKNVPNFKYILIHCGNAKEDTEGCILVGDEACNNRAVEGKILQSRVAYERLYPKVRDAILKGDLVTIEIIDSDRSE